MVVAVADLITCAMFGTEIFGGYDFTGVRVFGFPILHVPYNSAALLRCLRLIKPVVCTYCSTVSHTAAIHHHHIQDVHQVIALG